MFGVRKAAREFVDGLREVQRETERLKAENAKLREKYYEYESKMDGLVRRLTGGLLSKSAATPNDALYSVVEEQMTDELVDENFKLESENAKLREQVLQLQLDWEGERDYADQMEAKEKMAVAENAKLRKFSKSAWRVMTHNESPLAWKVMVATARELGIEENNDD